MGRPKECADLILEGYTPSQIARKFHLTYNSVVHYLYRAVGDGLLRLSDIVFTIPEDTRSALEGIITELATDYHYDVSKEAAERAVEICRGLLGLSRLQTGPKEMIPVNDIIKEATGSLAGRLEKRSISLRCRCPDDLAVYGQRVELTQVLLNMLINSSQAIADGGGTISISAHRDRRTGCINVTVADSGPGISPENMSRIFEPFFSTRQVPDSTGHSGTGLGLAIVREIAERHQGQAWLEDENGGTTFRVSISKRLMVG